MGREVLADGHKPTQLPALLLSRLWFNSRMSSCQGGACARPPSGRNSRQPHESSYRLRVSTLPSLQNSAHSGRHGGSLPFSFGVVADKKCTCPASKLMWERCPPTPQISTAGNSTNEQREAS